VQLQAAGPPRRTIALVLIVGAESEAEAEGKSSGMVRLTKSSSENFTISRTRSRRRRQTLDANFVTIVGANLGDGSRCVPGSALTTGREAPWCAEARWSAVDQYSEPDITWRASVGTYLATAGHVTVEYRVAYDARMTVSLYHHVTRRRLAGT